MRTIAKPQVLLLLLTAYGLVLRFAQFSARYSLNHDDICLALNIIGRNWKGLMSTLDYDQAAPLAFLWLERAFAIFVSDSDTGLQTLPFLFSCASVCAFALLAWRLLPCFEAVAATGFMAASLALAGAGLGVKPYSLDTLICIVLTFLILQYSSHPTKRAGLWLLVAGSVFIWFSFPAIFVLAGEGGIVLLFAIWADKRTLIRQWMPILLCWTVSAILDLLISIRPGTLNSRLAEMDAAAELPIHRPAAVPGALAHLFWELGFNATTTHLAVIAALALVAAIFTAFLRRDAVSLRLIAPLGICLLASALQRYPLLGRLVLFLTPLVLLVIFRELGALARRIQPKVYFGIPLAVSCAVAFSVFSSVRHGILADAGFDDPRGAIQWLLVNWHDGDELYASGAGLPPANFYGVYRNGRDGIRIASAREPHFVPGAPVVPVPMPQAGRVWFLYFEPTETDFDAATVSRFAIPGQKLEVRHFKNYTVALWHLKSSDLNSREINYVKY